jgi:hypothetical protein
LFFIVPLRCVRKKFSSNGNLRILPLLSQANFPFRAAKKCDVDQKQKKDEPKGVFVLRPLPGCSPDC